MKHFRCREWQASQEEKKVRVTNKTRGRIIYVYLYIYISIYIYRVKRVT